MKVKVALALPAALVTVTFTGYDPAAGVVPVMMPVSLARESPVGSPVAENANGACPVAGMANKKGLAGRAENVNGVWIRGAAGAAVVEMAMVVCADHAGAAVEMEAITADAIIADRYFLAIQLPMEHLSVILCGEPARKLLTYYAAWLIARVAMFEVGSICEDIAWPGPEPQDVATELE